MPKASHVYRKRPNKKYTTPKGSNNNIPHILYKHLTHSGSIFINLMTLGRARKESGVRRKQRGRKKFIKKPKHTMQIKTAGKG